MPPSLLPLSLQLTSAELRIACPAHQPAGQCARRLAVAIDEVPQACPDVVVGPHADDLSTQLLIDRIVTDRVQESRLPFYILKGEQEAMTLLATPE